MNWYKRAEQNREWSDDELQTIKGLIEEGNSFRQIASLFNTTHALISRLNNKYKWRDRQAELMEKYRLIANLYLLPPQGQGLLGREIKREYGFDTSTILRALEALGLKGHYRGKDDPYSEEKRRESIKEKWKDPSYRQMQIDTSREQMLDRWKNYPGGFNAWINTFSPEKQNEIMRAIGTSGR